MAAKHLGERPDCLPLRNLEEIQSFENAPVEVYRSVVCILQYMLGIWSNWGGGGQSVKDVVKVCFKEVLSDAVVDIYTLTGTGNKRSLHDTRPIKAIYEAIMRSTMFAKPKKADFVKAMQLVLKAAKMRTRISSGISSVNTLALTYARNTWADLADSGAAAATAAAATAAAATAAVATTARRRGHVRVRVLIHIHLLKIQRCLVQPHGEGTTPWTKSSAKIIMQKQRERRKWLKKLRTFGIRK
ncbi:uncharacterized protein LOC143218323 [Lasioglossum baleicum]|uniref:uncharacterized protein LOC143218323 n=1 Tax=Lasioglossum baleicum TaxID=434251 RepID=UPI003FCC65DF